VGTECKKWSDVKCSDVGWTVMIYVKWSELRWHFCG
jgi:hypothetical protein